MSVKLAILGMLKKGPVHGYELKSSIEKEMGDWTSIAFGSIYFALKKLTENNFVEQLDKMQFGNRPSRIIYKITDKGEKEFIRLLRELWEKSERSYYPFDIALYFSEHIEKKEAVKFINKRIRELEFAVKYVKAHEKEQMEIEKIPPVSEAVFSHTLYHLEAEICWLKSIIKYFE